MEYQFSYNLPAYNALDGRPDTYLPIIATMNCKGKIFWDIDRCPAEFVMMVKNWALVHTDVEMLATEYFNSKNIAA